MLYSSKVQQYAYVELGKNAKFHQGQKDILFSNACQIEPIRLVRTFAPKFLTHARFHGPGAGDWLIGPDRHRTRSTTQRNLRRRLRNRLRP